MPTFLAPLRDRLTVIALGLLGALSLALLAIWAPKATEARTTLPTAVPTPPAATGVAGLAPRLTEAIRSGRTVEIGVFGDSFGDGVWAGLYNILRGDSHYEVKQFSERSTGFTRYRSLNLLDDARAKLDANPIDIAVISYGANDTQGIYLDGHGYTFMSEGWQRIVTDRVTAIVNLLRQRGIQVYWVGLPKMREPQFDTDIRAMNAFYISRMQALGVPYIETTTLSTGRDGQFSAYLVDPRTHEQFNARTNDGIHMTIPGYILVMRQLTERIRRSVAQAGGPAAPQQANRTRTADSRPAPARAAANDGDRSPDRTGNDRDAATRTGREARSAR